MDCEQSLRTHIRKLLLPYALKHLTTDYAVYSQAEVIKLLSEGLDIVPIEDPTFLTLPVEPIDAFYSLYRVKEQPGFTETWNVEAEAKDLIKKTVKALGNVSGHVSTTACLSFDGDYFQVFEPMSTILTKRAISQTPVLGKSTLLDHTKIVSAPSMLSDFVCLKSVSEGHIEQLVVPKEDRDSLLGARLTVDQDTAIAGILKETESFFTGTKSPVDRSLANHQPSTAFLHANSPLPIYGIRGHMSPPIFPNCIKPRFRTIEPGKPSDIPSLGLIENIQPIRGDEEDISKEHMRVINGWTVMSDISSDAPSLENSSQATEFDELFALSTPQKPLSPNMDEYIIPRTHHPGGGDYGQIRKKDHDVQSLSRFLSHLLPEMDVLPSSNSDEPKSSLPGIPLSVLGQPPSSLRTCTAGETYDHRGSKCFASVTFRNQTPEKLGALIETLCAPVCDECPEDWVLSERLEEKETMMMNVPKMKEPCIHPTSPSCPVVPKAPLCLVVAKKVKDDVGSKVDFNPPVTALKKAPGLQSLNIELSWRPFNFQSRVPTTEELTDTQVFPQATDKMNILGEESVQNLLSFTDMAEGNCEIVMGSESLPKDSPMDFTHSFGGNYDIVLTNSERRKIYQGSGRQVVEHAISGNITDEDEEVRDPVRIGKSNKRARMATSPAINDLEMEIDTTVSGQATNATNELQLNRFASPEIDNSDCPLSLNYEVVEKLTKSNDSQISPVGFAKPCLHDSRQQAAETASGDRTSGDSSMDCIPPGMKWRNAAVAGQLKSPLNDSISKNSIKQLALAPTRQALADFLHIRAKGKFTLNEPESLFSSPPPSPSGEEPTVDEPPLALTEIPQELIDANTVKLPPDWDCPMTRLRYIGSLNVLQKTVLLEYLNSECHIDLVERDNSETHGADLIIDRETALVYVPLSSLHFLKEKLANRIASLSWRFELIVVVFEAFCLSSALRPRRLTEGNLTPYAFPAVTIKAIKTLKRLLVVMEMIEPQKDKKAATKSPNTTVKYAYARDVLEAAKFSRLVGDEIGATNMDWLCDEYTQDEIDLSHVSGMNIYAAAMLLRYTDVRTFVDMTPAERFRQFDNILGGKRIMILNEEIETRLATLPNFSSFSSSFSSPATVLPFVEENAAANVDNNSPLEFDYGEERTDVNWASAKLLGAQGFTLG